MERVDLESGASADRRSRSASAVKRVVIVADNSLIVEAIRIGFRKSGEFSLLGQADPRSTSAQTVVGADPDVVLLDDMDSSDRALELIRQIKTADAEIPVIVLNVRMDREWLDRTFEAGATAAISKSTHPLALATLVRETLNGHVFHGLPGAHGPARPTAKAVLAEEDLPLTDRELEILQVVAAGLSNGEVARRLWVTEQTVKFHLRNIYRKLDVANRTEASHFAHVNGLVSEAAPQPSLTLAS